MALDWILRLVLGVHCGQGYGCPWHGLKGDMEKDFIKDDLALCYCLSHSTAEISPL